MRDNNQDHPAVRASMTCPICREPKGFALIACEPCFQAAFASPNPDVEGLLDRAESNLSSLRIAALRRIVREHQYRKVEGQYVDATSASAILAVFDRLGAHAQSTYLKMTVNRMATVALRLFAKGL